MVRSVRRSWQWLAEAWPGLEPAREGGRVGGREGEISFWIETNKIMAGNSGTSVETGKLGLPIEFPTLKHKFWEVKKRFRITKKSKF